MSHMSNWWGTLSERERLFTQGQNRTIISASQLALSWSEQYLLESRGAMIINFRLSIIKNVDQEGWSSITLMTASS
jgi:hypothetical protein